MSKEETQGRIDDYLLGRASREERRELEAEITRNADLSQELAATERAIAAIELAEDRALKARLQRLEASLQGAGTAETGARVAPLVPRRRVLRLLAFAASFLLVLTLAWFTLLRPDANQDPAQLAMAEFKAYPNIAYVIERGGTEEPPEAAAYLAYEAGDYATAAQRFAQLPGSAVQQFYLGQSLLGSEDFVGAARALGPLTVDPDFNLAAEAAYYLALAQLGSGDPAAAIVTLEYIVGTPEHPYLAEAQKLLEQLQ
ncbi:hypothetical protein QWY85_06300 [Neolewinella lacunae]|uniref:Uncharacterized protein n=1 Tax=Neolewinella lacunae TaxID=1517758 RepID=A0A923PKE2_9BACT|nr:hypothetical protein [Neolewinella lacunae]MBC6995670.1 hypothetical protein [Neolewinella lacunae]MDN3634262.1 hypothetical protein [Neolewinella lacunae]